LKQKIKGRVEYYKGRNKGGKKPKFPQYSKRLPHIMHAANVGLEIDALRRPD